MKIYLVTRTDKYGQDQYHSAVVIAQSPKKAKALCIENYYFKEGAMNCELIGTAAKGQEAGPVVGEAEGF